MKWLLALLVLGVGVVGLLWVFQRSLIYLPTRGVPDPSSLDAIAEEVTVQTDDGLALSAWFLPPSGEGTVIVFNGNAGNRAHRIPLAEALSGNGYGVLLVDYRGYGDNPGSPSESGLAADARAARAFLDSRAVESGTIAYFGESLGAAVALGLALERPPAALVLRSPWTSLPEIASVHYPLLPTSLLLWDRYPSLDRVAGVTAPVMVVAGSEDRIVPPSQSREIYEAAPEPKELTVIEGAGHNDLALLAGEEMIEQIVEFLDRHLAETGGP